MTSEVASKMLDSIKVKADEGEEEEEEEEELVDPAAEIKEKCGEGTCSGVKVRWCLDVGFYDGVAVLCCGDGVAVL